MFVSVETVSLWGFSACSPCYPKEPELYTAPNLVTVGLVPSGKLLICYEIGKIFALNCVFLLLHEKLESAAELDWCDIFWLSYFNRKTVSTILIAPAPLLVGLYNCGCLFITKVF